jgi:hypothetical protein
LCGVRKTVEEAPLIDIVKKDALSVDAPVNDVMVQALGSDAWFSRHIGAVRCLTGDVKL